MNKKIQTILLISSLLLISAGFVFARHYDYALCVADHSCPPPSYRRVGRPFAGRCVTNENQCTWRSAAGLSDLEGGDDSEGGGGDNDGGNGGGSSDNINCSSGGYAGYVAEARAHCQEYVDRSRYEEQCPCVSSISGNDYNDYTANIGLLNVIFTNLGW